MMNNGKTNGLFSFVHPTFIIIDPIYKQYLIIINYSMYPWMKISFFLVEISGFNNRRYKRRERNVNETNFDKFQSKPVKNRL